MNQHSSTVWWSRVLTGGTGSLWVMGAGIAVAAAVAAGSAWHANAAATGSRAPAPPADDTGASYASATPLRRSEQHYRVPERLRVQRADGADLPLGQALFDGRPVVLTFMFSSCATVCPVTNQTLVSFETLLGAARGSVNTVSVSIDPDHDSVQAMADYARRTGGRGSYLTSDPGTSEAVQRAFDVWRNDKMEHQPVFLLSRGPGLPWVRLDGLVSPRRLHDEFRRLNAPPGQS